MNAIWNLQLLQFLFYFTFASNLGSIFLQLFIKRHYSSEYTKLHTKCSKILLLNLIDNMHF